MLFLLHIIKRNLLFIVMVLVGLSYAGINLPFMRELEAMVLGWLDMLGQYVDIKGITKQARDAIAEIRKYL